MTQIAAGEYPMVCGSSYHVIKALLIQDPKANIAIGVPSELPFHVGEALAVMNGAKYLNAGRTPGRLVVDAGRLEGL